MKIIDRWIARIFFPVKPGDGVMTANYKLVRMGKITSDEAIARLEAYMRSMSGGAQRQYITNKSNNNGG